MVETIQLSLMAGALGGVLFDQRDHHQRVRSSPARRRRRRRWPQASTYFVPNPAWPARHAFRVI
jgi:hypothetical protein